MKLLFEQLDRGEVTLAESPSPSDAPAQKGPARLQIICGAVGIRRRRSRRRNRKHHRGQCVGRHRKTPPISERANPSSVGVLIVHLLLLMMGHFAGFQQPVILADATAEQMYHATDQLIPHWKVLRRNVSSNYNWTRLNYIQAQIALAERSSLVSDCKAYQHLPTTIRHFIWYSDSHLSPSGSGAANARTHNHYHLSSPQQQQQQQQHPPEFNYHQHDQQLWYDEAATIQFQQQLQPHPGSTAVETASTPV
uniref:SCP domain-containing protein n=1 Tax=Macrostomum lignano TaxID=282301 RepID=A0A1I8F4D0_9PLAT